MSSGRYFKNSRELSRRDAHKQLVASLTRLVTEHPPESIPAGGGLFTGPTSVAYLFLALSKLYADLQVEGFSLLSLSAAYLKQAQDHMKEYAVPSPGHCGVADDILCLLAIGAASTEDMELVQELCDYASTASKADASNEWLYGRAGYLYLLRMVRRALAHSAEARDLLDDAADEVIEAMLADARPWKWQGKAYVGAVHGMAGIMTQIVLTAPAWAGALEPELGALLSYQFEESGNWPASVPPGRDRLVQVCHGAPGVVVSLLALRAHFPRLAPRIDAAVRRARGCVRERGLLTKEPCLCHGVSGNALALDAADRDHFLSYSTGHEIRSMARDGVMEASDAPASLWTGEAGRAWAWAVADRDLGPALLGYNDL